MTVNATATSTSILIGFLEILAHENEFSYKLMQLTKWIKEDRYYHTIIYMRHDGKQGEDYEDVYNTDKILKYLMSESSMPVMNLKGNTSYYLWHRFNRGYMAIVHLNGKQNEDQKLLMTLWTTLKRNLLSRFILLLRKSGDESYIRNILNFCYEKKVINVVVIRESLISGNMFYRMEAFPKFQMKLEEMQENKSAIFFIDQVRNMQGSDIRLVMNKVSSKCYILRKENGKFILGGFVGHFFSEFARKHNATLTFPNYENLESEMFISLMDAMVENGTYDASTEPTINVFSDDLVYTQTYDYMDWCLMVPFEESLPAYTFYVIVFDIASMVMILVAFISFSMVLAVTYIIRRENIVFHELLFNIYVLNGLLGQSFKAERYFSGVRSLLFMLICLSGLIFNTTYVTYLQTFNASPPKKHVISSMEDVRKSGMRIALYEEEFDLLNAFDVGNEFKNYIKIISSYEEYYSLRNSFDSRYIYPVPSAQWTLYEQQQKFFAKPRYRLTDICIIKMFGMQLSLQPNSPFEEAMNTLIGQVNQAGFVSYWKSLAFLESVQMHKISLEDKSTVSIFEPMKLEDMKLLMFLFIVIVILLCICFVIEVYWPHRGGLIMTFVRVMRRLYKRFIRK
ncbi:uncharacterized protein LOC135963991 [Calliphora vicina]|uniref:uncharacterized protein LOC135963991 n=1 Tax=Calliphora vicina TaxID=7373 RepID=UPI00325B311B